MQVIAETKALELSTTLRAMEEAKKTEFAEARLQWVAAKADEMLALRTQAAEAQAAAVARKKAARANKQAAQQPQRYPHVPPPAARDDGVAGIARLLGGADLK